LGNLVYYLLCSVHCGNFQVTLKFLYAPVDKEDLDIIKGNYNQKLDLPGTPGISGIGEVVALGPEAKNLKVGDRVINTVHYFDSGTWRSYGNVQEKFLYKVIFIPFLPYKVIFILIG
jgi:NADPH2:quinone reductase